MKADLPVAVEDLPAHVHVVAGLGVDRVEPADFGEDQLPEGHVAAGDVLGAIVGEQHLDGSSRGAGDHLRAGRLVVRRNIRSAGAADVGTVEGERQVVGPLRRRKGVAVEVGDEVAGRRLETSITRRREPRMFHLDQAHLRIRSGDFRGGVRRAVIDDDDLEFGVVEGAGVPEALVEGGARIVRADHDADRGPVEVEVANGSLVPAARDAKGGARRAILAGQPELPARHPLSAHPPLVRPREDACAGDPSLDRRLELPLQNVRLSLLAVRLLPRGNTDLPEHERPVTGQMLQLAEIAAEVLAALEKDVEHQEVDALQRQVLGGRIIGVGDQPAGVDLADDLDQLVERVRHGLQPVPAQDIGGNLVTQREPQDSRVPGQALARRPAPPCGPRAQPAFSRAASCPGGSASRDRTPPRGP